MKQKELREGLPPLPARMSHLPVDARGYPVPWFAAWVDGVPNFKLADGAKFDRAVKYSNCWICGQALGVRKTFVLGPMSIIGRVTVEPPAHFDCAEFAVLACPFIVLPATEYRKNKQNGVHADGALMRNPGVVCLWTTKGYGLLKNDKNQRFLRFRSPISWAWVREGRPATRDEVLASYDEGLPAIWARAHASESPTDAIIALENDYARAMQYLP